MLELRELWAGLVPSKPRPVPAPLVVAPLEPDVGIEVLPSDAMLDWVLLFSPKPPDAAA